MKNYWIKLYMEILHDPKMGAMDDHLWRRAVEMFLLAGEVMNSGSLPDVSDMAWTLRTTAEQLETDLVELQRAGILVFDGGVWGVRKWAERQAPSDSASALRQRKYRDRRQQLGMPTNPGYNTQRMINRDGGKCVYCGSSDNLCVDHVMPIVQGGEDDFDNLVCACKACNSGKSDRTPEQAQYKFINKDAEARYKKYVTVTRDERYDSASSSDSVFVNIVKLYEEEIGIITKTIADELQEASGEYPEEWFKLAIGEAARNNKRSWAYVKAILKRWSVDGLQSKRKPASGNGREIVENADGSIYV